MQCERFKLLQVSTFELGLGTLLKVNGKWTHDDGQKYHALNEKGEPGSMINLPGIIYFAAGGDQPEVAEPIEAEVTDARRSYEGLPAYFGPVTWFRSVSGHLDTNGYPIVDSATINFSAFKPQTVAPGPNAVVEYKGKQN